MATLPYFIPTGSSDDPLQHTVQLLHSLTDFYRQERLWVDRVRDVLQPPFEPPDSLPTPPSDSDVSSDGGWTDNALSTMQAQPTSPARWRRRRRQLKVKIDGLATNTGWHHMLEPMNISPRRQPPHREQILEMFEKMVEARLESCQRITKLVRNANRTDPYHH